jgi:hypothetical protein
MKIKKPSLTLAILSLTGLAQAATVNWGGGFFSTNYSADGTGLEVGQSAGSATGEVMYELGVFQNGDGSEFIPSFANVSEWSDRWVSLVDNNGSIAEAISGYNESGFNYFGGAVSFGTTGEQISTVEGSSNGDITGFQAYIWGFDSMDSKDFSSGKAEWFLVTGEDGGSGSSDSNWVIPDSSASNNGSLAITWDIASASTPIVGRIDNETGAGGMLDPGAGFGNLDHQFAIVPEPSGVALLLLGTLTLLRRKR